MKRVQLLQSVSKSLDTTPKQLHKRVKNLEEEAQQHSKTAQRLREAIALAPAAQSASAVVKDDNNSDWHFWVDLLPASLEGDAKLVRNRAMHLLQTHTDILHVVTAGTTVACAGSLPGTTSDGEGSVQLDARFLMRHVTKHFGGKGGGSTNVTMGRLDGPDSPPADAIARVFEGIKFRLNESV